MKKALLVLAGLAIIVALGAAGWFASAPRSLSAIVAQEVDAPGEAEAGSIVFFAAGCKSCHMSPGQPDPLRLGGGLELKTPFGSFYPPNISPGRQGRNRRLERGRLRPRTCSPASRRAASTIIPPSPTRPIGA